MRVSLNSLVTDKDPRSNWNLEVYLVFEEGGKPEYQAKNPRSKDENQQLGFEPGPHWWETSALTTAPSLLP